MLALSATEPRHDVTVARYMRVRRCMVWKGGLWEMMRGAVGGGGVSHWPSRVSAQDAVLGSVC